MKARVIEPVLNIGKDIIVSHPLEHDFVKQQITSFDGIEPEEQGGIMFKRDEARARKKRQASLTQLDILSAKA